MDSIDAPDDLRQWDAEEDDSEYVPDESSTDDEYEHESDDEVLGELDKDEAGDDDADEVESGNSWHRFLIDPPTERATGEEYFSKRKKKKQFSFIPKLNRLPNILPLDSPHILRGDRRIRGSELWTSLPRSQ
jgi:hypothetical protein